MHFLMPDVFQSQTEFKVQIRCLGNVRLLGLVFESRDKHDRRKREYGTYEKDVVY